MNRVSPKNSNRKYWLFAGLVLLVAAAAGYYLWITESGAAGNGLYQTAIVTRGTLTANIGATGTIRAGHSAVLSWNTSGRVEAVAVGVGDQITVDQVLARLATDSVPRSIILAKADMVTAQQSLDSLLQSNKAVAQAMKNLADAKQAVQDAQLANAFLAQKRVPAEVTEDISDQIDQAKAQLKQLEYFYKLFYSHRAEGSTDKALMIVQLTNSRQRVAELTSKYNWYNSPTSPIDMEKALAALNLAQAQQEDAQREMDRLRNGASVDDINAAKARVAAAQATFNQQQITAPFDGTVTQAILQAGDRISAGQTAFRVDDLAHLMVDLQISEVDINNVAVGQAVIISLDAVPNKTYKGIVSKVNLSAQAGQGGINFLVSVTLTEMDEQVKPGMTAAVTITVKEVGDAMLVPNRAVRMLAGQRIVYILKDNQPVPVNIRLGASADETSQVVGGDLMAGDLIILNPPSVTNLGTQNANSTLVK